MRKIKLKNKKILIGVIVAIAVISIIVVLFIIIKNNDKTINDNCILTLSGGAGEITFHTYVYNNENSKNAKYKYILTTSTTTSWGSSEWNTTINKEGVSNSIENIIEIAKKHGCGYAIYNGEIITPMEKIIEKFSD